MWDQMRSNAWRNQGITPEIIADMEIMVMMSLTNGELKYAAIEGLVIAITQSPKLKNLGTEDIEAILMAAWENIERQGINTRIDVIATLVVTIDQRIDAIGIAISIATLNGRIDRQKRILLEKLQHAFKLADGDVETAIQRYGNLPLLLSLALADAKGSREALAMLREQQFKFDSRHMQALSASIRQQIHWQDFSRGRNKNHRYQ